MFVRYFCDTCEDTGGHSVKFATCSEFVVDVETAKFHLLNLENSHISPPLLHPHLDDFEILKLNQRQYEVRGFE